MDNRINGREYGIALAGGGTRGAAHVGVLLALEEAGLPPRSIAGTSAGGIVAGLYAAGIAPTELWQVVEQLAKHGRRLIDPNYSGLLRAVVECICHGAPGMSGLVKGKKLERLLDDLSQGRPMTAARLRTVIPAVDLRSGQTIAYTNTLDGVRAVPQVQWSTDATLSGAMRASAAYPVVFCPKKIGGMCLVDGGVADNLPVNLLRAAGEENVLAVDLSEAYVMPERESLVEIASHTLSIMQNRLQACTSRGERLLLQPALPEEAGLLTFDQMVPCMQAGYEAAKRMAGAIATMFQKPTLRRTG